MDSKVGKNKPPARTVTRGNIGRPKGSTNKSTALLKDAILQAAELAGDKGGMVNYLLKQAHENPIAFMGLMVAIVTETVMTPIEWEKQWAEHHNDNPRH